MSVSATPVSPAKPHWIVSTHYRVRASSFAYAGVITSVLLSNQLAPQRLWVVLVLLFFVYPHLAYWQARRAPDSRRAEFINLHVDTVLLGLWSGLLGWPLWITFMLCITSTVNRVLVHGFRGSLWAMAAFFGAGSLVWFGWVDGRWRLAEDQVEVMYLCAIGTFVYLLGVAQIAYARTASLRKTRQELQRRVAEVESLQVQLLEQAIRDPLTQLYNRRHFDPSFEREWARCQRQRQVMSLMLLDIDHFKKVNDQYGHEAGDEVLRAVAQTLTRFFRDEDLVARLGGEEFSVLMPGIGAEACVQRAEALRERLAAQRTALPSGAELSVTVSIGVASYPAQGDDPAHLMRSADQALYAAKRAGRNAVRLGDSPVAQPANPDPQVPPT